MIRTTKAKSRCRCPECGETKIGGLLSPRWTELDANGQELGGFEYGGSVGPERVCFACHNVWITEQPGKSVEHLNPAVIAYFESRLSEAASLLRSVCVESVPGTLPEVLFKQIRNFMPWVFRRR